MCSSLGCELRYVVEMTALSLQPGSKKCRKKWLLEGCSDSGQGAWKIITKIDTLAFSMVVHHSNEHLK